MKHIFVDDNTHKILKDEANSKGMTLKGYMSFIASQINKKGKKCITK